MKPYNLKYWTTEIEPRLIKERMDFNNASEAYLHIKRKCGVPISVVEHKPVVFHKRVV
jgi:hypothetical protein